MSSGLVAFRDKVRYSNLQESIEHEFRLHPQRYKVCPTSQSIVLNICPEFISSSCINRLGNLILPLSLIYGGAIEAGTRPYYVGSEPILEIRGVGGL